MFSREGLRGFGAQPDEEQREAEARFPSQTPRTINLGSTPRGGAGILKPQRDG